MKKIVLAFFALISIAVADDINSVSKNPSMAVYGTQRTATAINATTIPVKVAGTACNTTTEIIAVTSDRSSQLICQSGTWRTSSGMAIAKEGTAPGTACSVNMQIGEWYGETLTCRGGVWDRGTTGVTLVVNGPAYLGWYRMCASAWIGDPSTIAPVAGPIGGNYLWYADLSPGKYARVSCF